MGLLLCCTLGGERGGGADLLIERCAGGDDLRLAEPGGQVNLEAAALERGALNNEPLVEGVPLCKRKGSAEAWN